MSRRDALPQRSARRSYVDPEEVYEDQPTRAVRPSAVTPDDLQDLADLEATRVPRESYVVLSELPQLPSHARSSHGFATELASEVEEDEVTSFVDRTSFAAESELREDPPESITTYAVRPSYVAREELGHSNDLRSPHYAIIEEVEPIEEIEAGAHAANEPTDDEALSRFLFDDVPAARNEMFPPSPPADAHERYADDGTRMTAPESHAPQSYDSYPRQAVKCVRRELGPMNETPVQPLQPVHALPTHRSRLSIHDGDPQPVRRSMPSGHPNDVAMPMPAASFVPAAPMRRPMPSVHPNELAMPMPTASFVPAEPMRRPMPSHHAYEAAMQQFQAPMQQLHAPMPMSSRRSMASVHPHDTSASPWVVPAIPSTRRGATVAKSDGYELTPSTLAAAFVVLLAATVMVAAIVFVRSEESENARAASAAFAPVVESTSLSVSPAPEPASPPVIVISSDDVAVPQVQAAATARVAVAPAAAPPAIAAPAPSAPVVIAWTSPVATPKPVATPVAAAPKPVAAAPVATPASTAQARTTTPAKKGGEKSVEDILKELGEEQLLR